MNSLIRKTATPFGALVAAVLFVIFMLVVSNSAITHAGDGNQTQNGRLLTIHDRGAEKLVLSQASTVGEALKESGIQIDSKDVVEPAVDVKLVASDYQVNIYRARPVIIVDGNIRQKVVSPYQTAEQIAKSVGIKLYDEDKATINRVDNLAEGAGLQLTIVRATPFVFNLYGKTSDMRTQGTTVGEMLAEKGIKLSKDDKVLPGQDTKLTPGLAVKLWREGKQTVTVDEVVKFDVDQIKDIDQPVGYLDIKTAGENGSRSVTYEVTVQNGQEISRTEIASIVTKVAKRQTEVVGAKGEYTTPSENENITWDFLIANGFSRYQTSGIMGNLMQEHGFNTSDTAGGYGIVQWTGSRRAALMAEPYPENIYTQLNFLLHELNTNYSSVRDAIKSTTTVDDAVIVFQNKFERCGVCMQDSRVQYARNILASH